MKKTKNIFKLKSFIFLCLLIFSFSLVLSASAQLVPCGLNGAADCTLCHLVLGFKNIYDYLLYIVLLPATILVIVIAGIMYMVSSGNKGMIDKAKSALTYAITAMVLALVAWLIVNATLNALGFKNAGSWYNFTCDTEQTKGPTGGTGVGTLPGTGGRVVGQGAVLSGNQTIDQMAQKMATSTVYNDNRAGWVNGVFNGDCSSWTQEFWKQAYGRDPGGSTVDQLKIAERNPDLGTLKPGDLLVMSGRGANGMHSAIYMGNGNIIANSTYGRNVVYGRIENYSVYGVVRAPG